MIGFRKFLQRESVDSPETEMGTSGHSANEALEEYHALVVDQLARGGVTRDCFELEVKPAGKLRDGRTVYVGMVRLVKRKRAPAVRLLLGFSILDSRLRRVVRGGGGRGGGAGGGGGRRAAGRRQD